MLWQSVPNSCIFHVCLRLFDIVCLSFIAVTVATLFVGLIVQESMEMIDNPLHEAAKRGNINFMNECIANQVLSFLISDVVCYIASVETIDQNHLLEERLD